LHSELFDAINSARAAIKNLNRKVVALQEFVEEVHAEIRDEFTSLPQDVQDSPEGQGLKTWEQEWDRLVGQWYGVDEEDFCLQDTFGDEVANLSTSITESTRGE
jgi:hypothetical protein